MSPQTFWMVWVSHTRGAVKRHPSIQAAETEAARLARMPENVGRKVYILEAKEYCEAVETPVLWSMLGSISQTKKYNFDLL